MVKIWPKMTKIDQEMLKIRQIDPKISKKCVSYCKIRTKDKNRGTPPQNPTAGPQTYWAPHAQVPQQFPALVYSPHIKTIANSFFTG